MRDYLDYKNNKILFKAVSKRELRDSEKNSLKGKNMSPKQSIYQIVSLRSGSSAKIYSDELKKMMVKHEIIMSNVKLGENNKIIFPTPSAIDINRAKALAQAYASINNIDDYTRVEKYIKNQIDSGYVVLRYKRSMINTHMELKYITTNRMDKWNLKIYDSSDTVVIDTIIDGAMLEMPMEIPLFMVDYICNDISIAKFGYTAANRKKAEEHERMIDRIYVDILPNFHDF